MNLDLRIQESVRARDAADCRSFFLKRLPYLTISSFLSLSFPKRIWMYATVMTSLRKPESMSVSRWISNWRSDIVSVFQRKTLYLLWKTNPSIRTCSRLFHFTCFERIAICTPLYVNSFDNRASSIGVSRYLGKECFSFGFVGSFGVIGCRCRRVIKEKFR